MCSEIFRNFSFSRVKQKRKEAKKSNFLPEKQPTDIRQREGKDLVKIIFYQKHAKKICGRIASQMCFV